MLTLDLVGVIEDGSPRASSVPENPRKSLTTPLGADLKVRFVLYTADGGSVSPSPVSLLFTLKKRFTDYSPLVARLATSESGALFFRFVPQDTKDLPPGQYVFDVWYTAPDGSRMAVIPTSPLWLEPAVTLPGNIGNVPFFPPTTPQTGPSQIAKVFTFVNPALAEDNVIVAGYSAAAANEFPGPFTAIGTPRNLSIVLSNDWAGGTITVTGKSQFNLTISEEFSATGVGIYAFKSITSIVKSATGLGTVDVGVGNSIGFAGQLIDTANAVLFINNAASPAVLNDSANTFTPAVAPDGATSYALIANVLPFVEEAPISP